MRTCDFYRPIIVADGVPKDFVLEGEIVQQILLAKDDKEQNLLAMRCATDLRINT